jgi:mono/diheme cytochrome c family protein
MRYSMPSLALVLLVSLASAAPAQEQSKAPAKPDAQKGLALAQRWCATCHVISSEQSKGTDAAPSFQTLAKRAAFDAEQLAFFLLDPHPAMPKMALTRDEARDIAAYIARLRE